jgi:hypothetical protein
MGGGLMQLVAYGAQDVYLTGNPQITFWKVTYRRHTNFAMESIEQTFNGQADFGRRVTCTISRNGDLAYRTYLQVTLPQIDQSLNPNVSDKNRVIDGRFGEGVYARWLDFPGEQLISQVEVEIGGQRIDRQYGDWMHIWSQLTLTSEQTRGYNKMVGNTTQLTFITDPSFEHVDGPCANEAPRQVCAPRNALPETTLYVPFQFWFNRNPGLALPLIALQYHEIRINLDLRPIDECLWAMNSLYTSGDDANGPNFDPRNTNNVSEGNYGRKRNLPNCGKVVAAYQQSLVAASLYVDYVFLDTDERRRMAQNPHEYLIEQVQFTGDESVGSSSNKIKLNFNHPCKELIWVVQPDQNVDYCSSLECGQVLNSVLGAQPFNYTDAIDALPNAIHSFGGPANLRGKGAFITDKGLFEDAGANTFDARAQDLLLDNVLNDTLFSAPLGGINGSIINLVDAKSGGPLTIAPSGWKTSQNAMNPFASLLQYAYLKVLFGEENKSPGALIQPVATTAATKVINALQPKLRLDLARKGADWFSLETKDQIFNSAGDLTKKSASDSLGFNITVIVELIASGGGSINLAKPSIIVENVFQGFTVNQNADTFGSFTSRLTNGVRAIVMREIGPTNIPTEFRADGLDPVGTGNFWLGQLGATLSTLSNRTQGIANGADKILLQNGLSDFPGLNDPNGFGTSVNQYGSNLYTNELNSSPSIGVPGPNGGLPPDVGALLNFSPFNANTAVLARQASQSFQIWLEGNNTWAQYQNPNFNGPLDSGVSDAGTFVLTETSLDLHCWGENPVVTAKLQLNGQDRFSEREGSYFDLVQPYQHHTRNPDTGINVYSFALRPEEHQPSGTANFSRIDNATMQLVLSNATVEGTNTAKVRVYATNYNVLRIMSGMGGLAYSN